MICKAFAQGGPEEDSIGGNVSLATRQAGGLFTFFFSSEELETLWQILLDLKEPQLDAPVGLLQTRLCKSDVTGKCVPRWWPAVQLWEGAA